MVCGQLKLDVCGCRPEAGAQGECRDWGAAAARVKVTREAWLLRRKAHRLMEGLPLPAEPRLALASPGSAAW